MNQYYLLIKNGFIDFKNLMIEKYHLLNLNETDAIILIKLQNFLLQGKTKLSGEDLAPTMSITANTISKRIVDLVKRGFITLTLSDVDASEVFSLDETYKRLSYIIEKEDSEKEKSATDNTIKEVVLFIEQEFKKVVTPTELEIVYHWVIEDKYELEKIKEAIIECAKLKKYNVKYVDLFLNRKPQTQKYKTEENLQELFNNVYAKIK
ncbi:MAG TPA: DnaD domain protein [Acholeplasmataceae bacterium]|nr:DnaD domain protein [Acholeplasmataceae bacterium]